jgi:hypothetical protein
MTPLAYAMQTQFYGAGLQTQLPTPNTLKVTQQEFAHDVAQMEFWGGNVDSDSLESGMPMFLQFGRPPLMRAFYGYVNHASRVNNSLTGDAVGRNALRITCVGASWPMKETHTTAYFNMTSTQIVEQIAATYGLVTNIVPDSTVWSVKNQAGQTDWQFICALMQEIGYTLYCSGVTIFASPRTTDPNSLTSVAVVYDYKANPTGLPIFTPTLGSNNPTGGQLRNRQLAAIDPRSGQVVYSAVSGSPGPAVLGGVQNTPPFTETEQCSAQSLQEVQSKVNGAGQANQLYITAEATGSGNPAIGQGSLVFVQNANGGQNGLWFTTKAIHSMNPQTYTLDMCFGRDSVGATVNAVILPQTSIPPTGVLNGAGNWVAA